MIQLVIFNQQSQSSNYGIKTYLSQLLYVINREIYNVYIINLFSKSKIFEIAEIDGVTYIEIPRPSVLFDPSDIKQMLSYYDNSLYLLKKNTELSKKIIVQLNYCFYASFIDSIKVFWPNAKIIIVLHYLDWCFYIKYNYPYFKNIIKKGQSIGVDREKKVLLMYKNNCNLFSKVHCIICLTNSLKQLLINDYFVNCDKIKVICNGLIPNNDNYITKDRKREIKKRYSFDEEDQIILYVGRLDDMKGLSELLRAFKLVSEIYVGKIKLLIVGDGDFGKYLSLCNPIWNNIVFTGKVSQEVLVDFYNIANLGILVSYHEQCSYVGIEMMMFGIPLIGTDSTGVNEMIKDGFNGKKIKIEYVNKNAFFSFEELAKLILSYLELPEEQKRKIRINCRNVYNEKYKIDIMKHKYIELYDQIAKTMK